jgi:hypothetical protein
VPALCSRNRHDLAEVLAGAVLGRDKLSRLASPSDVERPDDRPEDARHFGLRPAGVPDTEAKPVGTNRASSLASFRVRMSETSFQFRSAKQEKRPASLAG